MVSVKRYKSTALTVLVVGLGCVLGVGWVVDPDSSAGDRAWGIVMLAAVAAAGVGLWCISTERLTMRANQALITIGLIVPGAFAIQAMVEDFDFFVWVFGPLLALALLALWLGVIKRGVHTELG